MLARDRDVDAALADGRQVRERERSLVGHRGSVGAGFHPGRDHVLM